MGGPRASVGRPFFTNSFSRQLLRQFVEIKLAAAQVQDVFVFRQVAVEIFRESVKALLAVLLCIQQTRVTQNPKVLGDIVLADPQFLGNFVDAAGALQKKPHDPHAAFFAERFQRGDAVDFFHGFLLPKNPLEASLARETAASDRCSPDGDGFSTAN
jgi:hypothetical protein